ncbi:MAG: hypothetical protein DRN81_03025 [Thermoproteota archaeon]|nr:MAG: hypothetical protein DRN81_03025 [Candidatus Korarchaeota archaeon]
MSYQPFANIDVISKRQQRKNRGIARKKVSAPNEIALGLGDKISEAMEYFNRSRIYEEDMQLTFDDKEEPIEVREAERALFFKIAKFDVDNDIDSCRRYIDGYLLLKLLEGSVR